MSIYRPKNIQPRNGHTLVVLDVGRISGCESQNEVSLEDQHEHAEEFVAELYEGDRVEYRSIATKGKGEDNGLPCWGTSTLRSALGDFRLRLRGKFIFLS